MKSGAQRKLTRFYIINPISDRRMEQRFDSREDVLLRFLSNGNVAPAVALDVGKKGLRIETEGELFAGEDVEISFPRGTDHIRCFGQIVWVKPLGTIRIAGVSVESWHGVVLGEDSWLRYKGVVSKKDRRAKKR